MTRTVITSMGYGRGVGIAVDSALDFGLRGLLPFWWRDAAVEPERSWQILDGECYENVIRDLELWVAEHAVDRVFVHAGVVAIDGRAIVLPGRTFTGKSTLVTALLRAGADYASDEYAVLDAAGLVHPYPRAISLRQTDGSRRLVEPTDLGATVLQDPLPVGVVASLRHDPRASIALNEMSRSAAALALLDNTVCARSRPAEALIACTTAVDGSLGITGERGDASDTAVRLLQLLSDQA